MIQRMLAIWSLVPLPFPLCTGMKKEREGEREGEIERSLLLRTPDLLDQGPTSWCPVTLWWWFSPQVMSFDHMGYSLPGSSVHGIFQARILEWVSISFSRRSSQPRDRTLVSYIASGFFTNRATREASRPHLCDISGPWASVWTWTLCLTEFKKCWKLPFSSAQLPE